MRDLSPELICDRCGYEHGVVWSAPSDLWNLTVRGGDRAAAEEWPLLCPNCFMRLADERVLGDRSIWILRPERDGDFEDFQGTGRFPSRPKRESA